MELEHRPLTEVCEVLDFDFADPTLANPRGEWQVVHFVNLLKS